MAREDHEQEFVSLGVMRCVASTAKAMLVEPAETDRKLTPPVQTWIPKSQIADESGLSADAERYEEGELFVTEWFAEQEGLL